jgi:hypothetical protein
MYRSLRDGLSWPQSSHILQYPNPETVEHNQVIPLSFVHLFLAHQVNVIASIFGSLLRGEYQAFTGKGVSAEDKRP